jgi:hypothetical protein
MKPSAPISTKVAYFSLQLLQPEIHIDDIQQFKFKEETSKFGAYLCTVTKLGNFRK